MRMVEYQHRNEGGGNDVHLDNETWKHGESVLIVPKLEFKEFVEKTLTVMEEMLPGVPKIPLQHYDWLNEVLLELEQLKSKLGV